jgi:hypothetical protein
MCYLGVGCALGATEVQSSRENPDLVYTQINEDTSFVRRLRPIRRRDKDDRGGEHPPPGRRPSGRLGAAGVAREGKKA